MRLFQSKHGFAADKFQHALHGSENGHFENALHGKIHSAEKNGKPYGKGHDGHHEKIDERTRESRIFFAGENVVFAFKKTDGGFHFAAAIGRIRMNILRRTLAGIFRSFHNDNYARNEERI